MNQPLSREEILANWEAKAGHAKALLTELSHLKDRILASYPVRDFESYSGRKRTPKQKSKLKSFEALIPRIEEDARGVERLKSRWREEDARAEKTLAEQTRAEKDKEQAVIQQKLNDESIAYLLAEGLVIGKDFSAAGAIKDALDHAVSKEIQLRTDANEPEYLKGQCSECSEWCPQDHRCSCDNRRMYYDYSGSSFKDFYIYPAAN